MSLPLLAPVGAALVALALGDVLSVLLRRLALRHGFTDRPDPRKPHRRPTPYLGGIAIAVATLASASVLIPHWNERIGAVVAASTVMAVLGLVDDLRSLNPVSRLLVEGAAAATVVVCGGRIEVFGNWLDPVITILWTVILTNSFNLLDNMDGAAATVAVVSACFLAGDAYLAGQTDFGLLLLALAAGCSGFLVHNWAPARMFMGDAGSLFIGFLISTAAVQIHLHGRPVARIAQLFLLTFVATVDTSLVVISRRRAGRSVFAGGTDHASHRLHRLGWSVRQVALTLLAATAVACSCGELVASRLLSGIGALTGTAGIAIAMIWLLLKIPAATPPPVESVQPQEEAVPM